jgi:hypothetical protein
LALIRRSTSAAEIELYGRGEKIVPPGLDCLCCYLPICDKKPHCQALIEQTKKNRVMPRVECILIEKPSVNGPYGAKGVGEPPCIQPPAAIVLIVRGVSVGVC